jgi:cell division protein FtsW (lipid II flippase)/cell division protein FtsI/penicillin-binding protein 2
MRSRRTTELLLLLAGAPIVILLFAMYLVNSGDELDFTTLAVPIGLFAAFIIAHIAVRFLAPNADPALLPITFVLSGIGICFVMRLAPDLAMRQLMWLFLGIACMIIVLVFVRSIGRLCRYKYTIVLGGIILLLLPAVIGVEYYGSKIWISIAGFNFQPGEIAKICIVLFLAAYLAENREMLSVSTRRIGPFRFPDFKTLLPLLFMWGVSMAIVVFETDLGSALLFFGIFLVMVYVCTGRISYVLVSLLLLAVGGTAAYFCFSHVQARITAWLDPFSYAESSGYQIVQALYSLADGGVFGDGIGRGLPTKIPVVESDFIFVAIAEECGLLGAAAVLILFVLFAVRGFTIASRARKDVDALVAAGLTAAVSFQAFVIVGGNIGLIPLTGVTLPFMSQGGSSLLSSFIIVGLLLRTSDNSGNGQLELQRTSTFDVGVLGRVALGKRLTLLIAMFALLFAALIGSLTYTMIFRADYLRDLSTNNHTIALEEKDQRGSILTSDGVVLAESVEQDDGTYERVYPEGSLAAHIIGYYSTQFGSSGVELSQDEALTGDTSYDSWSDALASIAGEGTVGSDVVLTINSTIQEKAEELLQGETGAIVVLDPSTGAVLAMASSPTYDVNDAEYYLSGEAGSSADNLFNRATQGLYPPGSSMKTITLTARVEQRYNCLDDVYSAPASIEIGNGVVTNFQSEDYGSISLMRAFEVSSNTVFGQVAVQVGAESLVKKAEAFGFDSSDITQDFSVATSIMSNYDEMTEWETAWAGCGQPVGSHTDSSNGPEATVVQLAMVASAFVNDGTVMKPYIIDHILSSDGVITSTTTPEVYNQACSAEVAAQVATAMAGVIEEGTAAAAQVDGATVIGKTGTAQTSDTTDNAVFIGDGTANGVSVTVAIVIEDTVAGAATPKAGELIQTALETLGAL